MINDLADTDPAYSFTIFTPTYNRVGTLERLFDSIARQTFRKFEWLVVDDGSTDGTRALLERLAAQADFPVRYFWQPNAGKHAAFDRGVQKAKGALFLTIDSDDEITPDAVQVLYDAWMEIPEEERVQFTGVTARCIDQNGRLVGERFMRSPLDSDSAEATLILGLQGERVGFHRIDVLRAHPFPAVPTRFIPEGRVWLDIARRYRTRFIETPVRIFHDHDAPRLSALDRSQRAWGDLEYYRFALAHYAHWWRRAPVAVAKLAVGLRRAELHLGRSADRKEFSGLARLCAAAAWPVAVLAYARDLLSYEAVLGARLLVARVLLRGRGGPRVAALLGRLGHRPYAPSIAVHAKGVVPVLDPADPRNYELLFSPETFKADLLPVLQPMMAGCRKAAAVGENITFIALQLARAAPADAKILAVETEAQQSDRTRAAARSSYTDKVEAVTAGPNPSSGLLDGCDLLFFGETQTARRWAVAVAGEQGPIYLIVEIGNGEEVESQLLREQMQDARYRREPASTRGFSVWSRKVETPTLPSSA